MIVVASSGVEMTGVEAAGASGGAADGPVTMIALVIAAGGKAWPYAGDHGMVAALLRASLFGVPQGEAGSACGTLGCMSNGVALASDPSREWLIDGHGYLRGCSLMLREWRDPAWIPVPWEAVMRSSAASAAGARRSLTTRAWTS